MEFMKQKWSSGLVMGLVFTALVIGGCAKGDKGSISTTVANPSPTSFQPKGTIQGKVRDSVTLQPIVNAVVSIGLSVDVTDAQGQYILANVPATFDALNGTITGVYDMTVDLRAVTSPVSMAAAASATNPHYPSFSYRNVSVKYTSLNDTSCNNDNNDNVSSDTCTNASNHDTPVDGLATNGDVLVGKLDATITGVVAGCSFASGDFYTPQANAVVNLVSNVFSDNSTTGTPGHVVATTTADASGAFTFANIEANQEFEVEATDSAVPPTAEGSTSVNSPTDGQTLYLRVQESTAVHICPVDQHGPTIVAVSPEPGSDLAQNATESVTFTFSEPVVQSAQVSTDPSNQGGLDASGNLEVQFDGNKGTSVPYAAAWNATFDQLTITFATGTSSLYHVFIDNVGVFKDASNNSGLPGVCPQTTPSGWPVSVGGNPGNCVVYFSTNGASVPAATASLVVTNASSLDYSSTNAILDWPVISGARSYNLYCEQDQVYQDGTSQAGTLQFVTNALSSQQTINVGALGGFVENNGISVNEVGLQYSCLVRGVNSDNREGADSNVVSIKDAVGPDFIFSSSSTVNINGTLRGQLVLSFNEPVRESDAETLTNFVLTGTDAALTQISASYNTNNGQVTLIYSAPFTAAPGGNTITVTGVRDIAGNTNLTTPGGNNQQAWP